MDDNYFVECEDCGVSGPPDFESKVVAAWNRRAEPVASIEAPPIVAWVRRHPDGALTAEFLEDAVIEPVRKKSGGWLPMVLASQYAAPIAPQALPSAQAVLTDAEIETIYDEIDFTRFPDIEKDAEGHCWSYALATVRAIESRLRAQPEKRNGNE